MKRLWGRKVSDLGFAEFVHILEYEAVLNGCEIIKMTDGFLPQKPATAAGQSMIIFLLRTATGIALPAMPTLTEMLMLQLIS